MREALGVGGRAMTVLDGHLTVLAPTRPPTGWCRVVDLPMALSGLSHHNVLNALAGAAAALGLGIDRAAVVEGLRTFRPDDVLNPGRMNTYTLPVEGGDATVVVDLAHNEAGLEALLDVARGLVAPGGRVHLALGTAGDRTDEILQALGEIAGLRAAVRRHGERAGAPAGAPAASAKLAEARAGVVVRVRCPPPTRCRAWSPTNGDMVAVICPREQYDGESLGHNRHLQQSQINAQVMMLAAAERAPPGQAVAARCGDPNVVAVAGGGVSRI